MAHWFREIKIAGHETEYERVCREHYEARRARTLVWEGDDAEIHIHGLDPGERAFIEIIEKNAPPLVTDV